MSEAEQQEWGENYAKSDKRIQKQKQDKSQFKRSEQVNFVRTRISLLHFGMGQNADRL